MTGAQLMYCYEWDLDAKAVARVLWRANPGMSIEEATWITLWRMAIIIQHGSAIFNLRIRPTTNKRITAWKPAPSIIESKLYSWPHRTTGDQPTEE